MKQFKTMFGKVCSWVGNNKKTSLIRFIFQDLVKEFKSELSGDFWKVVRGLCFAPPEFDASELKNAVKVTTISSVALVLAWNPHVLRD